MKKPVLLNHDVRGEGPPLILLHGLFGSLENLGRIARLLAVDFQVHSLDLRNHGRSPHVDFMDYPSMVDDVVFYMDKKNLKSVSLLGHSMGGKVAMQAALNFPDRVDSLIVVDIAPVTYPPHHQSILEGLNAICSQTIMSRKQADQILQLSVKEVSIRQFLLKNLQRVDSGQFQWRIPLDTILHYYDDLMLGQDGPPYTGPVLFIAGGDSDYILPEHRGKVARLFPDAQLKVIPEATHWVHAQRPELFASTARRFLQPA